MSHLRKARGSRGEKLAAAFLSERGFRVLAWNWSCPLGEIDLIVEREGEVRFIEVKYRRTREFGYPEESVTGKKLRHLARAIEAWIGRQEAEPVTYQADVIAILEEPGKQADLAWFESVFS